MKLSELSTDRALDVLCEIAPLATNIVTDEDLTSELKAVVDFGGASTMAEKIALAVGKISKIIPILLKKRKAEIFGILGALNGKTTEEIANQNIIFTMKQVRDISKDKELLDFFKSCTGSEGSE